MRGMKARQCTLNGRREWRTTMGDRRFFRRRVRRFPRESTAHFERGRIFARWAPTDGDWTRVPAPLFAANRDFRNRRGIKNPDNCSLFSRWRDRSIFAQRPRAPRAISISSYRPLGDVIIAIGMRCLGTIASSTQGIYLEFLSRASIFFRLLVTRSSKSYIFFLVSLFVEECSVFVAAFNNCLCVFYFLIEYLEIIDLLSFTRIRIWNLEMFRIKIEVVLESINKLITRFIHSQRRYNFLNQSKIKIEKTYFHET